MKLKGILILIFILILSSVSFGKVKKVNLKKRLIGTEWSLTSISGQDFSDKGITLNIRQKEISGNSAVNLYFGGYRITGNNISVSPLGITQMAGEKKLMELEEKYIKILQDSKKISLKSDKLLITAKNGETLEFSVKRDSSDNTVK